MKKPTTVLLALLGALVLLAAGCGSSNKSSSSTSAASAYPTTGEQSSTATSTTTPATGSPTGTVVAVQSVGKLGKILVAGPKKLTVYLFEADKGSTSSCSGACATVWPPVLTTAAPVAAAGAGSAHLGTTTRSDGTKQVTYNGHPLYYYISDRSSGEATGQGVVGFGAAWYVLSPSGVKVTGSS